MPTGASAECRFRSTNPLKDNNIIYTPEGHVRISDMASISYQSKCAFCYLAIST
jgi:hypothetical protein